jgi:RNA polymerase II-associated factor 1
VETYELLPDPETFATPCDVFRFSERPGERPIDQEDPRLDSAILRPVITDDGDNFLAYYLPRDDEQALKLKEQRNLALELNLPNDDEVSSFRCLCLNNDLWTNGIASRYRLT